MKSAPRRTASPVAALALLALACGSPAEDAHGPALDCALDPEALFIGTTRDAIPALTTPEIAGANASFMRDEDRVLGVVQNGAARAYPFGILWWHEVVNDTLGGAPVLATYCPLTGSGIAFDPRVAGTAREFGVSGLVFLSNLVMFDRTAGSFWVQMRLGSECGPDRGTSLAPVAALETDWAHWRALHPNTTVITPNTGFRKAYFAYPYGSYADPTNPVVDFLPPGVTWSRERLPKELVLGVARNGAAVAYPLMALADSGTAFVVNDAVGDAPILVTYTGSWNTARAFDRRVASQALTFRLTDADTFRMTDEETGSVWTIEGEATAGPLSGDRLTPIADAFVAFWFAWSIFHPETRIYH